MYGYCWVLCIVFDCCCLDCIVDGGFFVQGQCVDFGMVWLGQYYFYLDYCLVLFVGDMNEIIDYVVCQVLEVQCECWFEQVGVWFEFQCEGYFVGIFGKCMEFLVFMQVFEWIIVQLYVDVVWLL